MKYAPWFIETARGETVCIKTAEGCPWCPVVETSLSEVIEVTSPGLGARIPRDFRPKNPKTLKQKQDWNKFNKAFKSVSHQKKKNSFKKRWEKCRNIAVLFPLNLFLKVHFTAFSLRTCLSFWSFLQSKFNVVQIYLGTFFITSSNSRRQKQVLTSTRRDGFRFL